MRKIFQVFSVTAALLSIALFSPGASFAYTAITLGYDFSYPNCSATLPTDGSFEILGTTGGRAFTNNSCLGTEFNTFTSGTQTFYMNLNAAVGSTASNANLGPKQCKKNDKACQNYNYGWQAAKSASDYAMQQTGTASAMWWFDIETNNSWTSSTSVNQQVIQGAHDYLAITYNVPSGVYSTPAMWQSVTGGWQNGMPVWYATGKTTATDAATYCSSSFTGGIVYLSQYISGGFDHDYACVSN